MYYCCCLVVPMQCGKMSRLFDQLHHPAADPIFPLLYISDHMMRCLIVVVMCEALDKGRSRTLEATDDNSEIPAEMHEAAS
mmetsp:Transcript_52272/g.126382  ORF Transcript_52272/g.126382 Transcript_52272/m.126382 type:complete len:81 (+) Transcript_52272:1613-1855(+)